MGLKVDTAASATQFQLKNMQHPKPTSVFVGDVASCSRCLKKSSVERRDAMSAWTPV